MICLLVRTDGRDHLLEQTLDSIEMNLVGPITRRVIHTDFGKDHVKTLSKRYPAYEVIGGARLGFGGAINRAWRHIATTGYESFVFDTEDDFLFNRRIPLVDMVTVLMKNPHIQQVALRRQPWNEAERDAGGLVEMWPEEYEDKSDGDAHWLEHRLFWTTNPSLFYVDRCVSGWPTIEKSEARYTEMVFTDPTSVSAFWGARDSGEWVHHIGEHRIGTGY